MRSASFADCTRYPPSFGAEPLKRRLEEASL
jgi:hypothetical protein